MADIVQDFPIAAPIADVFAAIATPRGLDEWWTLRSSGTPAPGAEYLLDFGPEYQWKAQVVACEPDRAFELELTAAMPDWLRTRVGFVLEDRGHDTWVRFTHRGWPSAHDHFRVSAHCWALYLRILRRYLEHGERVPYHDRLSA